MKAEIFRKIGQSFLELAKCYEEKPADTPATEPTIRMEDVRAVLSDVSHKGKTSEMKALLKKYGATKLSDIDPVHYPAMLAEAEAIRDA